MDKHNFLPGKIDKCQICGSEKLIQVIDLGEQPLANTLQKNLRPDQDPSGIISQQTDAATGARRSSPYF